MTLEATAPNGSPTSEDPTSAFIAEAQREAAEEAGAAGNTGIDPDAIVSKVLERLTPSINSLLDKRVSGFQQMIEAERREKSELASKLREYEVAGLSEDERAELARQEEEAEVERLRLQVQLYELQEKHPKGATIYRRLIEPGLTAEQQVALLDQLLAQAPSQNPAPAPEARDTVPVDHNNPAHSIPADAEVLPNGEIMTDEIADRILATSRWEAP